MADGDTPHSGGTDNPGSGTGGQADPPQQSPTTGYTPPATQEDLDRIINGRLQRDRQQQAARFADYDDLKTKAGEFDKLREQQMSEQEKAVAAARREAEAAARSDEQARYAERDRARGITLIDSFIAGAMGPGGRLDAERVGPVLEAIDKSRYLTEDGGIDTDSLGKLIDSLATPAPDPTPGRPAWPGLGQGRQETPPAVEVRPGMGRLRQAFGTPPTR